MLGCIAVIALLGACGRTATRAAAPAGSTLPPLVASTTTTTSEVPDSTSRPVASTTSPRPTTTTTPVPASTAKPKTTGAHNLPVLLIRPLFDDTSSDYAVVRPASIGFGGSADPAIISITWSYWSTSSAAGTGAAGPGQLHT